MELIQGLVLVLVAIAGTQVVLTKEPLRQSFVVAIYGALMGTLFILFQAPDVALSQIVVGAVALPLMILLALSKVRGGAE
jgi:energy-converting hydrogenase B subunit D